MKYIILTILQFIQFTLLDLWHLVFVFKKYEFNQFYYKNKKTGYIVKPHSCYGAYGNIFYLTKWDAFFSINKYESDSGKLGYQKKID